MIARPLRSALFLPANRASAVDKARLSDADAVILDLEDAVAPETKADARAAAVQALAEGGFGNRLLVVRINAPDSEWGQADLDALAGSRVDAVLLPKVSAPETLFDARRRAPDGCALWAMVESCAAFLRLGEITKEGVREGLAVLVIGTNDLALEMRCTLDEDRRAVLPLLTQAVVAARANGIAVLDGVYNDFSDDAGLTRQCAQGAALGFDGKSLIHPRQIAIANAAFAPSQEAVARSRAVIEAFALPENAGKGVIRVDGRMTELLHLREAERILAMADAIAARG